MENKIKLKFLILGDTDVGKTSLLLKYIDNFFPESHLATIGVEFKSKDVEIQGYKIHLQLWDTAGQERFRSITKSYFRSANGIIFVYDITDKKTFKNVKDWVKDSESHDTGFKRILLGNKFDLQNKRQVQFKEAKDWADKKQIEIMEVSAKLGTNVNKAIMRLAEICLENKSTYAFRKCGHMCVCKTCKEEKYDKLKAKEIKCPLCNAKHKKNEIIEIFTC